MGLYGTGGEWGGKWERVFLSADIGHIVLLALADHRRLILQSSRVQSLVCQAVLGEVEADCARPSVFRRP